MTTMNIVPAFSSPIATTFVKTNELKPQEGEYREMNEGRYISSSNRILEEYPQTKKIFLDVFKALPLHYSNDFMISTSWYTKMEKGSYSLPHNHKNCFWSGVYYFEESNGSLELYNPSVELSDFLIFPQQYNAYNSSTWTINPLKNLLVFFPSYLKHRVIEHSDEKSRYSLAFNIIPIGGYGVGDSYYDTSWF